MATLVPGSIVQDIRGSVGTETYSRNTGGLFVRNRTSPGQPESAERDLRQAAITAISQYWSGTLTEAQRQTWHTYAGQFPLPDRWGRPKQLSGYCHFVRSNVQRYRRTSTVSYAVAPTRPPLWPPGFSVIPTADSVYVKIMLPIPNYDPPPAPLSLMCFVGLQVPPGRSYFSSPYRYADYLDWNGAAWSNPDGWIASWAATAAGNKIWVRVVVTDYYGATSEPGFASAIAVPADAKVRDYFAGLTRTTAEAVGLQWPVKVPP